MLRFALVAALAFAPLTADADCASYGLAPKLLTTTSTSIPPAGGIVVAAVPLPDGRLEKGDPAVQASWRYKGQSAKPVIVSLAPGLAVMRVPAGTIELADGKGASLIKVYGIKDPTPLPAPDVKAIHHVTRGQPSYHGSQRVVVDLATRPPVDTVAVIIGDDKGARSWGLVRDVKATSVEPYVQQYCEVLPNGTIPSAIGDTVWVKFVNSDGRVSPASTPHKIVAQSTASP